MGPIQRALASGAIVVAALGAAACNQSGSGPGPAETPVVEAVLYAGTPPGFARRNPATGGYEVLPSSATILRMASGYPGSSDRMRVSLTPAGGAPRDLAWVSRDDVPGKQALDQAGYYEIVVDNFGYSLVVTGSPAERSGAGYAIDVVNLSPGGSPPESPPTRVAIEARSTVTKPSAVFFDCGDDYDAIDGRWHWNCKSSDGIIGRDFALQGWLVGPGANCLGGLCVEDFQYGFFPDPDFIDEYYGRGGAMSGLLGSARWFEDLVLPGNPRSSSPAVTLADQRPDGTSRGVTVNSFLLPSNRADDRSVGIVKGELNAWHPSNQGATFSRHWRGRGAPPAGWSTPSVDPADPNAAAWANTSWPFDPRAPSGGAALVPGQYVRLIGTLWQDATHDLAPAPNATSSPWAFFNGRLGAWLEIHPVDWVEPAVAPPVRKTPFVISVITYSSPTAETTESMAPDDPAPAGQTLRCLEMIDGRFTDMQSVTRRDVTLAADRLTVTVAVERRMGTPTTGNPPLTPIIPGRFKAVYVIWWEPGPAQTACTQR